ncbi:MAG: calcium/sodium antiporter [Lachnospiraceae bacterium]|nr:calcium/sodium antiporter [Lachnospiraceae bacterium]
MQILLNCLLIVVGFILLVKGADFFVDGAASVATKMGIPQIVVGLTIVAFGTSAPEAAISIGSALKGSNGISIGNVLGSNIMNILLILGVTSVICTLSVKKTTIKIDMPIMIFLSILLVVLGITMKSLHYLAGICFWLILIGFIVYLVIYSMKNGADEDTETKDLSAIRIIIYIIGGIAAIVYGSNITVDGATYVAGALGVSDRLIGLTVVAFGTSLPELVTSVTAARKKNADIAVGNIVGSNIFNIAFVLGTTCLIKEVPFDKAFYFDSAVTIFSALLLWLLCFKDLKLGKKGGITMLVCYAAYFVALLVM